MALKREDKRVFESEKEKGRKGGRREGEKWGIGGFFASRGAWALNKTRKCWSFLHHLGLSPQPRAGPRAPSLWGEVSPFGTIWHRVLLALSSLASWQECALTGPQLSQVHLVCCEDRKQTWETPPPPAPTLSLRLWPAFMSTGGEAQACPEEGAPEGSLQAPSTQQSERRLCPLSPARRGGMNQPQSLTDSAERCRGGAPGLATRRRCCCFLFRTEL